MVHGRFRSKFFHQHRKAFAVRDVFRHTGFRTLHYPLMQSCDLVRKLDRSTCTFRQMYPDNPCRRSESAKHPSKPIGSNHISPLQQEASENNGFLVVWSVEANQLPCIAADRFQDLRGDPSKPSDRPQSIYREPLVGVCHIADIAIIADIGH